MRYLFVTRGIPGSGKSTFIKRAGLEPFALSPDALRQSFGNPIMELDGRIAMPKKDDAAVWKLLYEILEKRMERGELIVIDATHTLPRYYNDYAKLAQNHRYKKFVIDFSNIPLKTCLLQNRQREPHRIVSETVITKMHARLSTARIPKGYSILLPDDVPSILENEITDLSQYTKIHHLGDIQGCYTPLKKYFEKYPFRDDEFYIFVGDLLDRGNENAEVLQYICEQFVDKPNVCFVEGNHDLYIWKWLTHQPITAREFNGRTRIQLEQSSIDKAAVSRLIRSMQECFMYSYGKKQVVVSHAGISAIPPKLKLLSSSQYIRGTGSYDEVGEVDDAFLQNTTEQTYQIHGHRNAQNYPTQYNERSFNLEGKVEFGGELRAVQLSADNFSVVEIANPHSELHLHPENAALVHSLRTNRLISQTSLPGNISSFHFKPEVFFKQKWTKQTITARGLFVHNLTNEIIIRAYDKFFNIGERRETELSSLQHSLSFPVHAWVKENGYLGLVGYDAVSGDLIISSKSTTEGDFAEWFRKLFYTRLGVHTEFIKQYLAKNNVCLLFEVILPTRDPHIIEYTRDDLVLLDIVKRQAAFQALPKSERESFAQHLGVRCKRLAATLHNWDEFKNWYSNVSGLRYEFESENIEGFVIEDSASYHVKIKLDFYSFWKQLRSALDALKAGKIPKIKQECTYPEEAAKVIAYMQSLPPKTLQDETIISIRRKFLALKRPLTTIEED